MNSTPYPTNANPKSRAWRVAKLSAINLLLGLPFGWFRFKRATDTVDLVILVTIAVTAALLAGFSYEIAFRVFMPKIGRRYSEYHAGKTADRRG